MKHIKIIIIYPTFDIDFDIETIIIRIGFNFLKTFAILTTLKILKTLKKDICELTDL